VPWFARSNTTFALQLAFLFFCLALAVEFADAARRSKKSKKQKTNYPPRPAPGPPQYIKVEGMTDEHEKSLMLACGIMFVIMLPNIIPWGWMAGNPPDGYVPAPRPRSKLGKSKTRKAE
jgi:hypothetical protein